MASIWEIVIKRAKGRLKLPKNIEEGINEASFKVLPIEITHAIEVGNLPSHHNDPFDRILISQAKVENLTLVTSDPKIWKYKVNLIKA